MLLRSYERSRKLVMVGVFRGHTLEASRSKNNHQHSTKMAPLSKTKTIKAMVLLPGKVQIFLVFRFPDTIFLSHCRRRRYPAGSQRRMVSPRQQISMPRNVSLFFVSRRDESSIGSLYMHHVSFGLATCVSLRDLQFWYQRPSSHATSTIAA